MSILKKYFLKILNFKSASFGQRTSLVKGPARRPVWVKPWRPPAVGLQHPFSFLQTAEPAAEQTSRFPDWKLMTSWDLEANREKGLNYVERKKGGVIKDVSNRPCFTFAPAVSLFTDDLSVSSPPGLFVTS